MATERTAPSTNTLEIPQSTASLFTEEQLKRPWRVILEKTDFDPEIVKKETQTMIQMVKLAESIFVSRETRGNVPVASQISVNDYSPLEDDGDKQKRRLWELKFTYGKDKRLEELEMSTGKYLQHFRIKPETLETSYYGYHSIERAGNKMVMVASEKKNHPLWIIYGYRKLEELINAATKNETADELSWGNPVEEIYSTLPLKNPASS